MQNSMGFNLRLKGLGCANCANKIESRVNQLNDVEEANLNFATLQLDVKLKESTMKGEVTNQIIEIVRLLEPSVLVEECDLGSDIQSLMKKQKSLNRSEILNQNKGLLGGALILVIAVVINASVGLYLMAYLLIGGKVLWTAGRNMSRGQVFDENFLMTIATLGAIFLGEYAEAIAVMLFYEVGEIFQHYAVNRSRASIGDLLDIRVNSGHLVTAEGVKTVAIEEIQLGEVIVVKPGERVPLDGVLISGESELDTSALTGESMLRYATFGDEILAGSINTSGLIKVRVQSTAATSTVARILEMVENASNKKATTERFITKFCRIYTPAVVLAAISVALVPPLVLGADFSIWLYRALVFLVVSCPCALVVSIPLGFFAGIGGASKLGVLVKGANYLELLNQVEMVVFDKTGTLTKGSFVVSEVHGIGISQSAFIKLAAYAESQSNHPIAKSIVQAYSSTIDTTKIVQYDEIAGKGIKTQVDQDQILIGNESLMAQYQVDIPSVESIGTVIYMVVNEEYRGYMVIRDEVKATSKAAIAQLKQVGVKHVVMLTGDRTAVAKQVAADLGIDEVHSQLLPYEKVEQVELLLKRLSSKGRLAFVGDGMNDAPVLARADIGVAMGGIGSDAAIEAADVVLMKDDPMALVDAIQKSQQTTNILYQNVGFALGIKSLVMVLSIFGMATMWMAVFSDVGVTILTIMNSIRALRRR